MRPLISGIVLGAMSWAVIANWIAPIVGWPAVGLGLAVLTGMVVYDLWTAPLIEGEL